MEKIIVHTDGGYDPITDIGGYGIFIEYHGLPYSDTKTYGSERITSHNRMELLAFIKAIELIDKINIPPDTTIEVFTDSTMLVNVFNKWADVWELRGWKRAGGREIKNIDLIQHIYRIKVAHKALHVSWIKGHYRGNMGNSVADELASKAIRRAKRWM